jgi:hypothetical protein
MRTSAWLLLLAILGWAVPSTAAKDDGGGPTCCARCGRHSACVQKACQLICDVKKETKTYWCVEWEEFCPLLPGRRDGAGECPPLPRCGAPKCVKKLVKKEYQVETPIYKCVVMYLCPECADGEASSPAAVPSAPLPRAPKAKN